MVRKGHNTLWFHQIVLRSANIAEKRNRIKKFLKDSLANFVWLLSMIEQQQKLIN